METEPELDFSEVVEAFNAEGFRFLLIGRQAVVLYGAPVASFDWDLWIDPEQREAILTLLEERFGCELSAAPGDRSRPIVRAHRGADRLDLFTMRTMVNRDGEALGFDDAWRRGVVVADRRDHSDAIRVPTIDDLILLKRMSPTARAKDEEDIRYLEVRKQLEADDDL